MRIRAAGDEALLIECPDGEQVEAWRAQLWRRREAGELTAREIVPGARTILLDGLTLWLSAVWQAPAAIDEVLDGSLASALDAIAVRPGPVVIVSDEVGWGIVPMHAGARVYRDLAGIAHQRIAAMADEVHLLVAGLPIRLKGLTE